jgi:hypothetical protein
MNWEVVLTLRIPTLGRLQSKLPRLVSRLVSEQTYGNPNEQRGSLVQRFSSLPQYEDMQSTSMLASNATSLYAVEHLRGHSQLHLILIHW